MLNNETLEEVMHVKNEKWREVYVVFCDYHIEYAPHL